MREADEMQGLQANLDVLKQAQELQTQIRITSAPLSQLAVHKNVINMKIPGGQYHIIV